MDTTAGSTRHCTCVLRLQRPSLIGVSIQHSTAVGNVGLLEDDNVRLLHAV